MESKLLIRRLLLRVLCLGLVVLFSFAALQAQSGSPASSFVFPRFVAFDDVSTGIAVFNPSTRDATLNLSVTGTDGKALGSTTIKVPALGQIAKTAGELFPELIPLDGSLALSSSTPGLVAYYQTFDSSMSFIDGTDAGEAAMELIFPVVPGSSDGAIELDFLNTNPRPTNVELKLWSLGGDLQGKATIQVPAGGIYNNLASNIFPPGTNLFGASHITAASKPINIFSAAQSVYGTSLVAGFSSAATIGSYRDIAALNAVPLTRVTNAGVIPYFRTGSQYASVLSLASIEPAKVDVTITAVRNDGSTQGTKKVTLNPNGGFRGDLQSVFPALDSAEGEGWLLLQAAGRVTGTLIYGRSDAAALSAIPMQTTPGIAFVFPQVVQDSGSYTEITLANPSPNTSYADIFVAQPSGKMAVKNRVTLGPGARVSQRLDQLFPGLAAQSGGYVFVRATDPLFATASIWSVDGTTLSNFAPETAPSSFTPPPPPPPRTRFLVTGRVTLNDSPVKGFRIVLSGPVGALATSGDDGSYVFRDLPAGNYSMIIDQFGFLFIPAQVNFEITTGDKQQDFKVITPPDGIALYPSAVPVKSSDTTVTIFGKDFNDSSQAFVGLVRLTTTFVDSNRLQVVVPAYMMAVPVELDVFVVTNDSGLNHRVSPDFPFIAFQDRPILTSVTSSAEIVEGSPATTLTLRGTGFLKDAKVKVNGVSNNIQVNVVDDTQIFAAVPASYFTRGGIYPVTVQNPYPANIESNIQLLTVYYPAPAIDGLIPGSVPARLEDSAGPLSLEVLGYGFRRGAIVLFNGQPIPTSYCENDAYCLAVHLYAQVPVSYLRQSGFAEIAIQNPTPSLAPSSAALLRIDGLQPTITSVFPGSATLANTPFQFTVPVVINGTNFGTQTVLRTYQAGTPLPIFSAKNMELLSSTQLFTSIVVDYQTSLGEWKVEVANPPPGGGQSDPFSFFLSSGNFVGNPFLISLNPQVVSAGGPAFTLTINGTNFRSGSQIYFYMTPLATAVVSDKQVRADVPASLIQFAGRVPISVINPDNGGTSNRLYLDIR